MLPTLQSKRALAVLYWVLPSLLCLWLHRDGLHAWYQADDFAWLGMTTEYYDAKSFWRAVFVPAAQGNIRPLTERLFFFGAWHWFHWNALPARVIVMATECANLVLLSVLMRRASSSALAGFAAPVLWVANSALVTAMTWTSAYEEVLCVTFLLGALLLWVRFCDTGKFLFYWLQIAIFILGFSVLELNLVFPGLAAAWAFCYRRHRLVWTAPLFALSLAFYKLHTSLAPTPAAGPYHPQFGFQIFATFAEYWKLTFLAPYGYFVDQRVLAGLLLAAITAGVLLFLVLEVRSRRPAALFFACWFVIVLAPLLPFQNHITHYYLSIPSLGVAAVMALALVRHRFTAAAMAAAYLAVQIPALLAGEQWMLDRSRLARTLLLGLKQVHEWEPNKGILLTGVSKDLYGVAVADVPFRLIKDARIYLAPESVSELTGLDANLAPVSNFVLPPDPVRHGLLDRSLVVYSAANGPLQEETAEYTARVFAAPDPDLPRRVDPGSPALAYLLGPEWYPVEGAYRWMPRRATLRMAGPRTATERLYINGFTAEESRKMQPLTLAVTVDGQAAGSAPIGPNDATFARDFTLPAEAVGKPSIEIALSVNRTFGRDRELGLVFGTFEIR